MENLPGWWPFKEPYFIGDCKPYLEAMPDSCVGLVIADPPYGIDYQSQRPNYKGRKRKLDNTIKGDTEINIDWLPDTFRVMKEDSFIFLFTRWDVTHIWKEAVEQAGFRVKQRLIWDKSHWGSGDLDYYGTQIEDILFCIKGKPEMNWRKRKGNIIKTVSKRSLPEGLHHPNQKAVKLIRQLIRDTVPKGAIILSPFLGCGTDLEAAIKEECVCVGWEIDPQYEGILRKRSLQGIRPFEDYFEQEVSYKKKEPPTDKGKEIKCPKCNSNLKRTSGCHFFCGKCMKYYNLDEVLDSKPNVKQVGEEKECGDCAFNELKHREDKCDNCVILSNWKPKDTVEDKDL